MTPLNMAPTHPDALGTLFILRTPPIIPNQTGFFCICTEVLVYLYLPSTVQYGKYSTVLTCFGTLQKGQSSRDIIGTSGRSAYCKIGWPESTFEEGNPSSSQASVRNG
jgi:hypothetical protein